MIFTSSLLKGYQVLLGGPAIAITMIFVSLITDIPSQEMFEQEVGDYSNDNAFDAKFIWWTQIIIHIGVVLVSFFAMFPACSNIGEYFTEVSLVTLMVCQFYVLILEI